MILYSQNINTAHGPFGELRQPITKKQVFRNLDVIAERIIASGAVVVCLQEVDFFSLRTAGINQLEYLVHRLGFSFYHGSSHLRSPLPGVLKSFVSNTVLGRDLGTVVISKYPLSEHTSYDFGQSFSPHLPVNYLVKLLNECKGFTFVMVSPPDGPDFGVYSTHLLSDIFYQIIRYLGPELRGNTFGRGWQIQKLHTKVRSALRRFDMPMVIAGDFNAIPRSSRLMAFPSHLSGDPDDYTHDPAMQHIIEQKLFIPPFDLTANANPDLLDGFHTYPAVAPNRTLDYIFLAGPGVQFARYEVDPTPTSDHRAVVAELLFDQKSDL